MRRLCCLGFVIGLAGAAGPAYGQWFEIADPVGTTVCGAINAADGVLLVIGEDGRLVLIRSTDLPLENTAIDEDLVVYIDEQPVGTIDYATDQGGHRRAFWITPIGTLYGLTPTGEAVTTNVYPDDVDALCDPCEYWDITADCLDEPLEDEEAVNTGPGGILLGNLCGAGGGAAMGLAMAGMLLLALTPAARPRL
jgi:hypothetical protein